VARTWAILLLSAAGLYLIGLRGYSLLFAAFLAWVPALFLDATVGRILFPPFIRVDRGITSKFIKLSL
jgi:hypothetical protein